MNSAALLATLIIAILIFVSVAYSARNKNIECYQGVLTILLLMSAKVILYCLGALYIENIVFNNYMLAINASLTPVIASLILLTSLEASSTFSHSKGAKKTIGLIAFFFMGVIISNPFHNLAFTLNNVNEVIPFGYTEGILLHISNIYSAFCVLLCFIFMSINIIKDKMYCRKTFAFIGSVFAIGSYFVTMYMPENIYEELIAWGLVEILLYLYVFVNNDFNFIPVIKDNTFEMINDGMLVVNKKFIIKDYNKALTKLFGDIDFSNVIGKKIDDIFKYYPIVIYAAKSNRNESIKIGAKDYSMLIYNSLEKKQRNVITTITFKEATTIAMLSDKENSNIDPLTKLKTKDEFYRDAEYEFNNAVRYNMPFILAQIEICDLYKIKSEIGEIAGNLLLTNVSSLIQREIRKTDVLARIEEDKFALLLTHTSPKFVDNICERIREKVDKHSLAYEDKLITTNVVIGVYGCNEITNQTIETFIKGSNDELLKARKENKSCVKATII